MSYQRSIQQETMGVDKEIGSERRPRFVAVAFWWYTGWCLINFLFGLTSSPYPYAPWTHHAAFLIMSVAMLCGAVMVERRNLAALAIVVVTQFLAILILISLIAALVLSAIPLVFLVMPQSLRWLKSNSHFSILNVILSLVLLGFSGVVALVPSVSEDYISNVNPLSVFVLGEDPIHELDESNQHVYDYWKNDAILGKCIVQYNNDKKCCCVNLDLYSAGITEERYYQEAVEIMKDFCDQQFDCEVEWSEATADNGRLMWNGRVADGVIIKIFPSEDKEIFGTLLVYNPQLSKDFMDFDAESSTEGDSDSNRKNLEPAKVVRGKKPQFEAPPKVYGKGLGDGYGDVKGMLYKKPIENEPSGLPDVDVTNPGDISRRYKNLK